MHNKEYYTSLRPSLIECPACGCSNHDILCRKDRYQMGLTTVGCLKCGLIFINPRPSEAMMLQFYERDYRRFYESVLVPNEEYVKSGPFLPRAEFVVEKLEEQVKQKASGSWLDIGCAEGTLLKMAGKVFLRWRFYGVEPSVKFGEYARTTSGAEDVYIGSFDSFIEKNSIQYDVITLCHVLEHIFSPVQLLEDIKSILKPDGIIYIEVPNITHPNAKGIGNIHLGHVLSFSPDTLVYVLNEAGFSKEILFEDKLPAKTPAMAIIGKVAEDIKGIKATYSSIQESFRNFKVNICGGVHNKKG